MHTQRVTADTILVKEFGQDGERRLEAKTDHFSLTASASQDTVRPGNRFTLLFELELPEKMHVYAPQAKSYDAIPGTYIVDRNGVVQTKFFERPFQLHELGLAKRSPVGRAVEQNGGSLRTLDGIEVPRLSILIDGLKRRDLLADTNARLEVDVETVERIQDFLREGRMCQEKCKQQRHLFHEIPSKSSEATRQGGGPT